MSTQSTLSTCIDLLLSCKRNQVDIDGKSFESTTYGSLKRYVAVQGHVRGRFRSVISISASGSAGADISTDCSAGTAGNLKMSALSGTVSSSPVNSNRVSYDRERCSWTDDATRAMLSTISELDVSSLLDSKRQRNKTTFEQVESRLREAGYVFTWKQIRARWKNLKQSYNKVSLW